MPNRIIKESLCTSEKIAALTDFEFRLWVGLITTVDDAGRGDARPLVIKGRVFPLRDRATVKEIDAALHGLAAKGCVSLYTVDGKPYFWFPTWTQHQRLDRAKPKYPGPDEQDCPRQSAATCGDLRQSAATCGVNTNTNPNTNTKKNPRDTPPIVPPSAPSPAGAGAHTNGYSDDFELFWAQYPKKTGKGAAYAAWCKQRFTDQQRQLVMASLARHKASYDWTKDGGQYIPNPATWLNQARFQDEPRMQAPQKDDKPSFNPFYDYVKAHEGGDPF